ncbi:MAG: hypothetical protein JWR50_2387 [Mucilaginibacter sp.]|nr:hypothetical protein [Mucilaginibacter sp.]
MKNLYLFITITLCCVNCFAQEIVERKNKLTDNVTEQLQTIIEAKRQIKQGTYHAFYKKKTVIASGTYMDDKRTGIWNFFAPDGTPLENFDYNNNKLLYEAPQDKLSHIRYNVDYVLTDSDKATPPIRLGGRYFGYVPYLHLLTSYYVDKYELRNYMVVMKLLVSPMGRLADYKIEVIHYAADVSTYTIDMSKLSDEDKTFIPATFNDKTISSQISIYCIVNDEGEAYMSDFKY